MKKILASISARSNFARLSSVLDHIELHPNLELIVVLLASAAEQDLKVITAQYKKSYILGTQSTEPGTLFGMSKTTAKCLKDVTEKLEEICPDAVLVSGDRFEIMAPAIAASYSNIPLIHIQGGEKTGSIDDKVRNAVTKMADLHFVCTQAAKKEVVAMGEENVYVTGCPSIDLVKNFNCDVKDYLLIIQHPDTTDHSNFLNQMKITIDAVKETNIPYFCIGPNIDAGTLGVDYNSVDYKSFYDLLCHCACLVGNSSSGIREGSYLGIPVVNIGQRQRGRERSDNVIDVPHEKHIIKQAIDKQYGKRYERNLLYGDGTAGEAIARLIAKLPLFLKNGPQ